MCRWPSYRSASPQGDRFVHRRVSNLETMRNCLESPYIFTELFLPPPQHDTPYRDDPSPSAAKSARPSPHSANRSRPAREGRDGAARSAHKSAPQSAAKPHARHAPTNPTAAKHAATKPQVGNHPRGKHAAAKHPVAKHPVAKHPVAKHPVANHPPAKKPAPKAPARKRSGRRGRRGGGGSPGENQLTSTPTSRNAYVETRVWLLAQHGPVCAYCGRRFTARVMTLDHVAPRRGQTAYDRRDNLVLACPGCNAAKRDLAPLAFLLGARLRAANLLRYGGHLSPMLIDMATSLAPADAPLSEADLEDPDPWDVIDEDGESPYRD
jgi:HNH endonuclease